MAGTGVGAGREARAGRVVEVGIESMGKVKDELGREEVGGKEV